MILNTEHTVWHEIPILHDLQSDDPPALVIVDSQTDLINKISHLALFDPDGGPLADRLILITPRDIDYPPALNIFDVNRGRLGQYDEATKEQVTAGVIQTFDYLFNGLLGADLTAKQGVFFRFVARLMLALPETMGRNATILDLIALMDDAAPYRKAIESLPPIQRNFFERDFASKTFAQTKEQIRYRLNAILENPTLARLFTSPKTKVDLFTALNNNAIILVDTAKDFLKGSSAHFGRIFISLVLQAVLERAALPEHERKPAFLIVDDHLRVDITTGFSIAVGQDLGIEVSCDKGGTCFTGIGAVEGAWGGAGATGTASIMEGHINFPAWGFNLTAGEDIQLPYLNAPVGIVVNVFTPVFQDPWSNVLFSGTVIVPGGGAVAGITFGYMTAPPIKKPGG